MPMQDGGTRMQFEGGAVRETQEDKTRPELITPFGLHRLADWYAKGDKKYPNPPRNWERGMPLSRVTASIFRHLIAWMKGDKSEDHIAAIAWNAFAIMHYQEMMARKVIDSKFDDMPNYNPTPEIKDDPTRR